MSKMFSIIIPTYNCCKLIKPTLDSIINQDENWYECIVVDGLSQDGTIDIVKEYSEKFNCIKYISEKDNGIYDAMNKGIDLAKGEYLYFIGAGDQLEKGILNDVNLHINNELEIIYGDIFIKSRNVIESFNPTKYDLIHRNICHQRIFYNRKIFDLIGKYNLKYNIAADYELNIKVFADQNIKKTYTNKIIGTYLGGGYSEQGIDKVFENNISNIILENISKETIKALYKELIEISKEKKYIGWAVSSGYEEFKNVFKIKFDYLVDSDNNKILTMNDGYVIYSPEKLLNELAGNEFIIVFTITNYNNIRKKLESRGLKEFKNFICVSKNLYKILNSCKED